MTDLELNQDVIAHLATLPPATRDKLYAEIGEREWQRCADDMLYWLDASRHFVPYVYTRDPKELYTCRECADGMGRTFEQKYTHLKIYHNKNVDEMTDPQVNEWFDSLPTTRPFTVFPYTEPIIRTWLRHKILLIEKSRDMVTTWLTVVMYTWDTLFHQNRENVFQSNDSSKTIDLVERAHFIWNNQPSFLKNVHKATFTSGQTRSGIMRVPDINSVILGFPDGADQFRYIHPSGVFVDEAAFQKEAEATFAALRPAIGAGGRYTAVSSANPGFFQALCRDLPT